MLHIFTSVKYILLRNGNCRGGVLSSYFYGLQSGGQCSQSLLLKLRSKNLFSCLHFDRSSDRLFRSCVWSLNVIMESFSVWQSRHRLLMLL